jgi:hypothetical protein
MGRGLTIGQLREELFRVEELLEGSDTVSEEELEQRESEATAGAIHVFGMALIQIAQELNELKHAYAQHGESADDSHPFIH